MKKIFVTLLIAMLVSSVAFAADFAPTLLKLTADPIIQYDFDGSDISIPYTVSGHTAGVIFLVFTKGKADQIPNMINGYLGWHHVNKVDTCVYASTLASVNIGANTVNWNGKDDDGGVVPPGEYTYYLWAFDNQGAKEDAARTMPSGWGFDYNTNVAEVDEEGLPIANPIWYTRTVRWIIGNDPVDETLEETTDLSGALAEGWGHRGEPTLQPDDYTLQYACATNTEAKQGSIVKYKWVPNGTAEIQTDWGEEDGYATIFSTAGGGSPGTCIVEDYLFTGDENHVANTEPDAQIYIYDMDGFLIEEFDLTPWWSDPDALEVGAQMNGGPNNWNERDGYIFLNCHCNCLNQMLDPMRYMESEEYDDMFVWSNGNGDYTLDHNFEDTAQLPWVCNDYNVGPYKYCVSPDGNYFTAVNAYDVGAVSFGLMAPDGTGLGYLSFAGETAGWKKGEIFIDADTAYDGCYCDNEQTQGPHYDRNAELNEPGIFFIGHDSISGIITNAVGVAEDAPAAFDVAQNAPNPFNPTTTISFTLAEAGDVSVEVFNVAGQKIDTITDGFMNAGSNSVVWDASDFSAGVYFYTVKSGNYSKTMKMTLVK
jgi:hypothetical protein